MAGGDLVLEGGQLGQGAGDDPLGAGAGRGDRRRLVGGAAGGDQLGADLGQALGRHQQHQGVGGGRGAGQLGQGAAGQGGADHRVAGRQAPVGDRDAGVGGGGHGRADPGNDLERHPGLGQGQSLLAAAAEHERVPAPGRTPQAPAPRSTSTRLMAAWESATRPRALPASTRSAPEGQVEQGRRGQPVVDDHVRPLQHLGPPQRQQPRVPRPAPTRYTIPLTPPGAPCSGRA